MGFLRRLNFQLWYLRRPPWDSRIVPPEVDEFIHSHPAGRALDLGCGTGTSSLALAKAGWKVTGVDFTPGAIRQAKERAQAAGLSINFLVTDVTRLPSSLFEQSYDLVLDIGCYHGLPSQEKKAYGKQLEDLLAAGGIWMMYGFFAPEEYPLEEAAGKPLSDLRLLRRESGHDRKGRPSAWFWYTRPSSTVIFPRK